MVQTYSCDFEDCGNVFTRAYELKKHKATHDNPESVFHCPQCDFITLQKKSLAIHFALHTGEKIHQCPDLVTSSPGEPPVPCEYKTNDPAALSKHRKRVHEYVPPPNRTRPKGVRKPLEQRDENVTQPRRSPRCHTPPPSPRKTTRAPRAPKNPNGATSVTNPSPLRNEIIDLDAMDVDGDDTLDADLSGATLFNSDDEEMSLDMLSDPTLSQRWMAKYEESYTTFEPYVPKPPCKVSSPALDGFDMDARREGCLCPEWMEEAGIDGWSKSVVEDAQEIL